jgi:L-ascorbate metabolism protein UlaG (beta-lactamase superfamily)
VSWLGNTNVLVTDGDTAILTDAWFTRPSDLEILFGRIGPDLGAIDRALERAQIEQLAAVIPVHSHFDHAMDAPEVAERTGAMLLGSESTANIGRGWGLAEERIRVATPGQAMTFGDFQVTLFESRHFEFPNPLLRRSTSSLTEIIQPLEPPVRMTEYAEGGSYSVLIAHPDASVLIQGSAGYLPGALEGIDVDAVFLSVGGIGGQTERYQSNYWAYVVNATTPEKLFPVHWDSFTHSLGERPQAPNLFWDQVFGLQAEASIQWALDRAADDPLLEAWLLPLWEPVSIP